MPAQITACLHIGSVSGCSLKLQKCFCHLCCAAICPKCGWQLGSTVIFLSWFFATLKHLNPPDFHSFCNCLRFPSCLNCTIQQRFSTNYAVVNSYSHISIYCRICRKASGSNVSHLGITYSMLSVKLYYIWDPFCSLSCFSVWCSLFATVISVPCTLSNLYCSSCLSDPFHEWGDECRAKWHLVGQNLGQNSQTQLVLRAETALAHTAAHEWVFLALSVS